MEILETIRLQIRKKVIDFVSNPDNINKILLLTSPQGTGKSITTAKTLLENNISYIHLGPGHSFINNLITNPALRDVSYLLTHIKGRTARQNPTDRDSPRMCVNRYIDMVLQWEIEATPFLCNARTGRCPFKGSCEYLKQWNYIIHSWASDIHYMHTGMTTEPPKSYDVLVLDENPLDGLHSKKWFNVDHLTDLERRVNDLLMLIVDQEEKDIEEKGRREQFKEIADCYAIIQITIERLKTILNNLKESITGKELIDLFFEEFKFDFERTQWIMTSSYVVGRFINHYKEHLYNLLENMGQEQQEDFKNIFYLIIDIVKIFIRNRNNKQDINIPVFAKKLKIEKNRIVLYKTTRTLPENKYVIVCDATGDKDMYEHIFGKEVIEFNPAIEITRNVIQVTDGMYPKASLFHQETRNRLYNNVLRLTRHWINHKECKKVFIVIHKAFSTLSEEEGKYVGMSIERFFQDNGLDKQHYDIRHYEKMKGENIEQLYLEEGKLIIIGEPEPNIHGALESASIWYEGEPVLSNERIEEPPESNFYKHNYRYKDDRYNAYIKSKREHLLEHNIERIRFIFPDPKKEVILWTMLPVRFKTEKLTTEQLKNKYMLYGLDELIQYKVLKKIEKEQNITLTDFYNKTVRLKGIEKYETPTCLRKFLIEQGWIKVKKMKNKTKPVKVLTLTEQGKRYIQKIENFS